MIDPRAGLRRANTASVGESAHRAARHGCAQGHGRL